MTSAPAPVPTSPTHLPAVFSTAESGVQALDHNLEASLGAVLRAAVVRSADAASTARQLGVTRGELFRVARGHGVRLPWCVPSPKREGC